MKEWWVQFQFFKVDKKINRSRISRSASLGMDFVFNSSFARRDMEAPKITIPSLSSHYNSVA